MLEDYTSREELIDPCYCEYCDNGNLYVTIYQPKVLARFIRRAICLSCNSINYQAKFLSG